MVGGRTRMSHQRDAAVFCSDGLNFDYESFAPPQTGKPISLSQFLNRQRNKVYQKTGVNNAYQPRVSFQIGGNSMTSSQRSSKLALVNRLKTPSMLARSHGCSQSPVRELSRSLHQQQQSATNSNSRADAIHFGQHQQPIHEKKDFSVAGKRLEIQKAEAVRSTLTSLLMRRNTPAAGQSKSTAGFDNGQSEDQTAQEHTYTDREPGVQLLRGSMT